MKKLILMRHAKSSWDNTDLDDHARVLNGRGRISADAIGDWLRGRSHVPDQALVSDSARTRETFSRLNFRCDARFVDALYHASAPTMMRVLKEATGDTVLMLGHNPGIAEFAERLVNVQPDHPRFYDYPTCATLVAAFDLEDWAALTPKSGRVLDFTVPREVAA